MSQTWNPRRRKVHRAFWRVVNPVLRHAGRLTPWWVVIETRGRKTGLPRRLPLATGPMDGDSMWLYAAHGRRTLWVKNIEADPSVRLRIRGRWRQGRAEVLPVDPEVLGRFNPYARSGRFGAMEPVLVRVHSLRPTRPPQAGKRRA